MILTLDFETKDPYIDRGLGSGWVYGMNVPDSDFKVLGCAIKEIRPDRERPSIYGQIAYLDEDMEPNLGYLHMAVAEAKILIMHNAAYDLGCLDYLGIDYSHCKIYDTMVAGKLHDSSLLSHSLDNLSSKYLGEQKKNDLLGEALYEAGYYPMLKKELKQKEKVLAGKVYATSPRDKICFCPSRMVKVPGILDREFEDDTCYYSTDKCESYADYAKYLDSLPKLKEYIRTKPEGAKLSKFAKQNMDLVQEVAPEAMAEYACQDVDLTFRLYQFYQRSLDDELVYKYSSLSKICNSYRKKGVRVDLDAARSALNFLNIEIVKALDHLYNIAGQEFNISSPKEVTNVLHEAGLKCPRTDKGSFSATAGWMEAQDHPVANGIVDARKLLKIKNDFILKIIEMQEFTCPGAERYGRIYPELNLLRATTGRFSCSSPNVQQIPSRDDRLSPLCKGLFVPEAGERLFSLDFSNQEGRLQVHYAYLLECTGASDLKIKFDNDPKFDMHQAVAKQMHIDRRTAKTINLGLSYGMGSGKLAKALGVDISYARDVLMYNYFRWVPWLSELKKKCEDRLKTAGEIKTLGGRVLKNDPPAFVEGKRRTFEYKALNKLIQGSAADQTIECMIKAYEEGIPVMFPVHDQLLMSGTKEQALRLREIMENAVPLCIPVVVDMNEDGGESWLKAGH